MKSILTFSITVLFFAQSAIAGWTTIPNPQKSADKASAKISKMTKNVKVVELLAAAEPFFSVTEYEALQKKVSNPPKAKRFKIDKIMHGKDMFFMQVGDIKLVFKWVDKDNIAFTLNGHSFSYEEAAKADLWQNKVFEVVKKEASKRSKAAMTGGSVGAFALLEVLLGAKNAQAFDLSFLKNPWVLGAIGIGAVALIGNHFYGKHKEQHAQKRQNVKNQLEKARKQLDNARAEAEASGRNIDLSSYEKQVKDLETLLEEYSGASQDVGFFGYLFGNRIRTPARYDVLVPGAVE